jgi:inosine/xanthosine triphosphatase
MRGRDGLGTPGARREQAAHEGRAHVARSDHADAPKAHAPRNRLVLGKASRPKPSSGRARWACVRVCLGGTFDVVHKGHERLLAKAFEAGTAVFIGVTSQRMASRHRSRRVRPLAQRIADLEALLRRKRWTATVSEIDEPFGRAVDPAYDAIVVSPETEFRVAEINKARSRRGLKALKRIVVGYAYAQDGLPISATRIRKGDIDAEGVRLKPLRVAVGTANALKRSAVADAFARMFPGLRSTVRRFGVASGVPEQPTGSQTAAGALMRAEAALGVWKNADYGVGVEAGLIRDRTLQRTLDVQYCAVVDARGTVSIGHGGGFYYPDHVLKEVAKGTTISDVLGPMAGDRRIGSTTGAIGFLTKGAVTRRELTEHAVSMALVPRVRPDFYDPR